MDTTSPDAKRVVAILRAHEAEWRRAGVRGASVFGSVARGEDDQDSDVDLAVQLDPAAGIGFGIVAIERRMGQALGRPVQIVVQPVENPRLRAAIERDGVVAF